MNDIINVYDTWREWLQPKIIKFIKYGIIFDCLSFLCALFFFCIIPSLLTKIIVFLSFLSIIMDIFTLMVVNISRKIEKRMYSPEQGIHPIIYYIRDFLISSTFQYIIILFLSFIVFLK